MPEGDTIHHAARRLRPGRWSRSPRAAWLVLRMQQSARDGNQKRFRRICNGAGRPCPRCGGASLIRSRGQDDDNRTTYWCPGCQS